MELKAIEVPVEWNKSLPIYASNSFLSTISGTYGWIGGAGSSGRLACILPYTVLKKSIFNLVRFTHQTIPLGKELTIEQERAFLAKVLDHFRATGTDIIIPPTFNTVFRTYPKGAIAARYGSFILDITQTEETLWKNLHKKHRNSIRNAQKNGVKILTGTEHLETAIELVAGSFKRSTTGFADKIRLRVRMNFDSIRKQVMSLNENATVFVAEHEGVIQGCAILSFSDFSAYYMHGGSIARPQAGSMNLLQWEAIKVFKELGVQRYNFVGARIDPEKGSKIEAIMNFKRRFGGTLVQGYMWKMPFNPLKYFLYSKAAQIRSGGDIVDQEQHKLGASNDRES